MRILLTATLGLCGCLAQLGPDSPGSVGLPGECSSTAGLSQQVPDGPPPIAGGTLLALPDGKTVVASDPDNDTIWITDTTAVSTRAIALGAHDEPGRLALDGAGRVHVVLRRGGAVVTIDPTSASITRRDEVCPAPRGIAYDATRNQVHVACMGGELISLPATGGAPVRTLHLVDDLRDVLVVGSTIHVTRFRSAELLTLRDDGNVIHRSVPEAFFEFAPSVAWRTIVTPGGSIAMLHQRSSSATIELAMPSSPPTSPGPPAPAVDLGVGGGFGGGGGGYGSQGGSNCTAGGSVVQSALSVLTGPNANTRPGPFSDLTLPVDVATTPDGSRYIVVGAAVRAGIGVMKPVPSILILAADAVTGGNSVCTDSMIGAFIDSQAIAAAGLDNQRFVVQTRNVSMLWITDRFGNVQKTIPLSVSPRVDTGHDLFHTNAGANIACASCHPEGGDDGRVWKFNTGARRTMPLRGGLRGTEPFHWSGDETTFAALMADVFSNRMHGQFQPCDNVQALANWMESIPVVTASVRDPAAVARGDALFHDASVGCASCHSGDHFTNNQNTDVGTGEILQVPRLTGLAFRAPYLHDGRAATLKDRFTAIGGGDLHGHTSELSASQVDDLVAYLSTL